MKFFGYYKDGAIIQRGKKFLVRGYAEGEVVCSLVGGVTMQKKVVSEHGRFSVEFDGVTDTESVYTLSAKCGEEENSVSVRFGDVYLAMGQSNMSYCLAATEEWEGWKARAAKADVAFLNLEERHFNEAGEVIRPAYPQEELAADYEWVQGDDERISATSALCVQTATALSEAQGIPVAFVHTSMGGLSVESYVPREALEGDEIALKMLKETGRYVSIDDYNTVGGRNYTQLASLWNEKIFPLIGIPFKGIAWYLGESSCYDLLFAECFLRIMQIIKREYAKAFGDIPFVAVQIAPEYYPYGDKYGYLYVNEAISRFEQETGAVCLPVYDIEARWRKADGELYYHPIHPVNKAPIAARLTELFLGKRTSYPQITSVRYEDGKAICKVSHVGEGLKKGRYNGFTIAAAGGKYYPADAVVSAKDEIVVSSPEVGDPAELTYAFMQYQDFCDAKTVDLAPLLPYRSVVEPISARYYFPPAFTVNGALEVYENNFGWQIGDCRKVATWKDGSLYNGARTEITAAGEELCFSSSPTAEDYFLFGVSPALCLTGHKHHIADFAYWNCVLRAESEKETYFLGVVVRTANGELYRLDLVNGAENAEQLPVEKTANAYTMSLTNAIIGDSSRTALSKEMRENIVEAEFLFRAFAPVKVYMKDLTPSDIAAATKREAEKQRGEARLDIQLPENSR